MSENVQKFTYVVNAGALPIYMPVSSMDSADVLVPNRGQSIRNNQSASTVTTVWRELYYTYRRNAF